MKITFSVLLEGEAGAIASLDVLCVPSGEGRDLLLVWEAPAYSKSRATSVREVSAIESARGDVGKIFSRA